MLKLVTPDGRYHGDVKDKATAKEIAVKAKYDNPRVITEEEFNSALGDRTKFATLGEAV